MAYSYLSSTSDHAAESPVGLLCIIPGMPGSLGIVKAGLTPSPQRPGHMFLRFLILCALSILCSKGYSQSAKSRGISKPPLTTSSMTCMELQRRQRTWYSNNNCSFTLLSNGPEVFSELWACRFRPDQIISFSFLRPVPVPGFCMRSSDTCLLDNGIGKINVSWYQETRLSTDTCEDI